jgi:hypothetical protein
VVLGTAAFTGLWLSEKLLSLNVQQSAPGVQCALWLSANPSQAPASASEGELP